MSSLLFPETPTIGQHEAQLMFQGTNVLLKVALNAITIIPPFYVEKELIIY